MNDPLTYGTVANELVNELRERGLTVAIAESFTGGLLSASIVGVPGASDVLRGGIVVYATELKAHLGGVDFEVLSTEGPISANTARQLAIGVARNLNADWGVSLTGVAGPEQQDDQAPGTVFCGFAHRRIMFDDSDSRKWEINGDRWEIRLTSSRRAMKELLARVRGEGGM